VLGPDQQINRAALGEIAFRDPEALRALEGITHPAVVAEIRRQIAASDADVIVVEAIKLVESGLLADVDSFWLVTADPRVRARRLAERRGLSEREAQDRLKASAHFDHLDATPDVLIDNSGDMSRVARAVADAWLAIVEPATAFPIQPAVFVATKENA
jgi:dephospho-CoA kinase